ncbi:MAG: cysteine hydrolase [Alphaproteobacteria bacterium]|nr:cysteine hydrolase [Alphaproteobacteria bacterium]
MTDKKQSGHHFLQDLISEQSNKNTEELHFALKDFNPLKTRVLVVDVQRDYFSPEGRPASEWGWDVAEMDKKAQKIANFIDKTRHIIKPIFIVMEETWETRLPNAPKREKIPNKADSELTKVGTKGHELHRVKRNPNDPIFLKHSPSAFHHEVGLREYTNELRKNEGLDTLIIVGGLTSRCVDGTLIGAFNEGFKCIVLEDLMGTPKHLQEEGEHAKNVMDMFHANILQSEDIEQALKCYEAATSDKTKDIKSKKIKGR